MKLNERQVEILAFRIAKALAKEGLAKLADPAATEEHVKKALVDDLSVEDRLNEEVRELLLQHEQVMRAQSIPYHEMFQKVKKKLVRERKLIL